MESNLRLRQYPSPVVAQLKLKFGTLQELNDSKQLLQRKIVNISHYRKSVGALVVYDVTNRDSFLHVKKWLDELKDHAEPDIQIVLVGNKLDLVEQDPSERKVTVEEAKEFAFKNKLLFYESSAEKDKNVKTIFSELLTKIYDVKS